MKRVLILSLLCLTCLSAYADADKPLISVFDFKGNNVSAKELDLFVDFLTSEIVATNKYTLIDRSQRETILAEIEFSLTGCTDETCQLEAGKLLQANEIVMGSIGVFGEKTLLNMKLIEVETGATISSVSQQYDSFNDVIVDNQRLVRLLLKEQNITVANGNINDSKKTELHVNFELFKQTDEFIKDDLDGNFQLIQINAKQLSPQERNALFDSNDKNVLTGTLLNVLPGFGIGSFLNGDTGLGVMQLVLEGVGLYGMLQFAIRDFTANEWDNEAALFGVGAIVYSIPKIAGALVPVFSYNTYNEDLSDALNLSK